MNGKIPLPFDPDALQRYFEAATGVSVRLTVTDNTTSLVRWRRVGRGELHVRLHRIFLEADEAVFGEMAGHLAGGRGGWPLTRDFFRQRRESPARREARPGRVRTAGDVYDLQRLYDAVNRDYFGNAVRARITWGRRSSRRGAGHRTLGSYDETTRTIRISPYLDRRAVPSYVVENVVHHEMLHAFLGIESVQGRRRIHTPRFREMERRFRHYERAASWEKDHIR